MQAENGGLCADPGSSELRVCRVDRADGIGFAHSNRCSQPCKWPVFLLDSWSFEGHHVQELRRKWCRHLGV